MYDLKCELCLNFKTCGCQNKYLPLSLPSEQIYTIRKEEDRDAFGRWSRENLGLKGIKEETKCRRGEGYRKERAANKMVMRRRNRRIF